MTKSSFRTTTNTIIGKSVAVGDKANDRPYPFNQVGYFAGFDVNAASIQVQQRLLLLLLLDRTLWQLK